MKADTKEAIRGGLAMMAVALALLAMYRTGKPGPQGPAGQSVDSPALVITPAGAAPQCRIMQDGLIGPIGCYADDERMEQLYRSIWLKHRHAVHYAPDGIRTIPAPVCPENTVVDVRGPYDYCFLESVTQ